MNRLLEIWMGLFVIKELILFINDQKFCLIPYSMISISIIQIFNHGNPKTLTTIPNANYTQTNHLGIFVMAKNAKTYFNEQRRRWYVYVEWQGRRYYYSKYLGKVCSGTNPDQPCKIAAAIASEINSEIDKGIFQPGRHHLNSPLYLKNYFEKWISSIQVENATIKDYKNSFLNHILPVIGNKYLIDINYDILRDLQNRIKRSNKGKKNVMGALHKMLTDAIKSGYISQMPVFPGFTGRDSIEEKVPEWLSIQDQLKILAEIQPADQYIFQFIFLTGCRPSEARAFQWRNIRQDRIVFTHAFGPLEELKPIKNKRQRSFPITAGLRELLNEIPKNLSHYIFLNSKTRRPYTKNINRDIWNPASMKAIGSIFPLNNAGRHSFANQILEATDNISVVSKALGHSTIQITKKHYGDHSIESMRSIIDNVRKIRP